MKITEVENKMKDRIDFFEESLSEIRAGRANPAILNRVMVEYYGTPTPINQVSSVSVAPATNDYKTYAETIEKLRTERAGQGILKSLENSATIKENISAFY